MALLSVLLVLLTVVEPEPPAAATNIEVSADGSVLFTIAEREPPVVLK